MYYKDFNIRNAAIQDEPKRIPLMIAMANEVIHKLGFRDRVNGSVQWDDAQCEIPPGDLASALVLTMFSEKHPALHKIGEWYEEENVDTCVLFGKNARYEKLNDDALGRMLDKIYAAGAENIYMQTCVQTVTKYQIMFKRMHSDTTTVSFYGEYGGQSKGEGVARIVPGHNKDNRPGSNQLLVGKIVTEQGIPLCASTMSGNTSDVEWNAKALEMMSEIHVRGLGEGVYIADAKLMTHDLFKRLTDPKRPIRYVSRVPANFSDKLEYRVIERAYEQDEWEELGQFGSGKNASYYYSQSFDMEVHGRIARVMAVRSSAGGERWEHRLEKYREKMDEAIAVVAKKEFACEADARKEYERFKKSTSKNPYGTTVQYINKQTEKRPVGRPSKKAPAEPQIVEKWRAVIMRVGLDEVVAQVLKQQEETFVLASNCMEMDDAQLLGAYKGQHVIEVDFSYLKDPSVCSVVFLKSPERIRALIMLMHVALLVRSVLQYQLRKGRKAWNKPLPKIGWNGAKMMDAPTAYYLECKAGGSFFKAVRGSPYEYDFIQVHHKELTILMEMMGVTPKDLLNALHVDTVS